MEILRKKFLNKNALGVFYMTKMKHLKSYKLSYIKILASTNNNNEIYIKDIG